MPKGEKIGALWENSFKHDGGVYFKGRIGDQKVVVFQNGYKDSENKPDWIIYEDLPREDAGGSAPAPQPVQHSTPTVAAQAALNIPTRSLAEDDIPF